MDRNPLNVIRTVARKTKIIVSVFHIYRFVIPRFMWYVAVFPVLDRSFSRKKTANDERTFRNRAMGNIIGPNRNTIDAKVNEHSNRRTAR